MGVQKRRRLQETQSTARGTSWLPGRLCLDPDTQSGVRSLSFGSTACFGVEGSTWDLVPVSGLLMEEESRGG